jgi:hypothetical protein
MKKLILAFAIVSLSISSISCTAEELPTQPEQNLELNNATMDNGEGTITPPRKGN